MGLWQRLKDSMASREALEEVRLPGVEHVALLLKGAPRVTQGLELLDDSRTTMEFVVRGLVQHAGLTEGQAVTAMAIVHERGGAVVGLPSLAVAEAAASGLARAAAHQGFPLRCRVVRWTDDAGT